MSSSTSSRPRCVLTRRRCSDRSPRGGQKAVFVLDEETRLRLREELAGAVACVDAELTVDGALAARSIERGTLLAFITAGLRREARMRYLQTQTLLREGLPHATIRGGHVTAKVILDRGEDGSIMAHLANERNVKSVDRDAISELTFEFNVDAFPSIR